MRADDSSTFVGNEGYSFDDEVEMNLLAPCLTVKTSRKMSCLVGAHRHHCACSTLPHHTVWVTAKLPAGVSSLCKPISWAHAV